MRKTVIIFSIAFAILAISIHVGMQIFSLPPTREQPLDEPTSEWTYHSEHIFYAERPSLGGIGRERLVCIYISRRYDIILHRYEIRRYSFDQKINYLVQQVFPYSIHMIGNRGLMKANVSFNSVYDILVIPSEEMSLIFLARAEEYSYTIYPIRIFNLHIFSVEVSEEGDIDFLFSSHTETETWESLNARRN